MLVVAEVAHKILVVEVLVDQVEVEVILVLVDQVLLHKVMMVEMLFQLLQVEVEVLVVY